MRTPIILAACLLLVSQAHAQSVPDCYNGVGIFLEPNPSPVTNYVEQIEPFETMTAYVVLANPYNENTGAPIRNLGGFEFRLEFPENLQVNATLREGTTNFLNAPDYLCGTNLPAVDDQILLMTLEIAAFSTDPGGWFITPVLNPSSQSIPGEMAVADADDEFSLSRATPVSYSFDLPVMCMFEPCGPLLKSAVPKSAADGVWGDCWVISAADSSFGDQKAMFR